MKKLYKINQFTAEQWDGVEYDWNEHDDEIVIIEKMDAYCMDITANGKRIVPILRKIEETLTAAGLAGESGIFAGWFGEWANELTGSYYDRKNFIWDYSGRSDRERGCWSYSWGIEQIDEDRWYIFLNIAKPTQSAEQEQEAPTETEQATEEATPATTTAPTDAAELDNLKAIRDDITTDPNPDTIRAAQNAINRHFVEIDPEDIDTPRKIRAALTDIINAIYWDIAEDITPRTTATA